MFHSQLSETHASNAIYITQVLHRSSYSRATTTQYLYILRLRTCLLHPSSRHCYIHSKYFTRAHTVAQPQRNITPFCAYAHLSYTHRPAIAIYFTGAHTVAQPQRNTYYILRLRTYLLHPSSRHCYIHRSSKYFTRAHTAAQPQRKLFRSTPTSHIHLTPIDLSLPHPECRTLWCHHQHTPHPTTSSTEIPQNEQRFQEYQVLWSELDAPPLP
jgi:hypothetical protein